MLLVAVSPIVELEMNSLLEVGKMSVTPQTVLDETVPVLGLVVSDRPFRSIIGEALKLHWTRDPFDRLIAAHAIVDGAQLLTADRHLLSHLPQAVWDGSEPDGG